MVSTNDTAKQIQFSSLKQDAAEAAFKGRHSFGSSDAFKQIFDGIEKTAQRFDSSKDKTPEPVKPEVAAKAPKREHTHRAKHDDKDNHRDVLVSKTDKVASEKEAPIKKVDGKDYEADCHDGHCQDETADISEPSKDSDKTVVAAPLEHTEAIPSGESSDVLFTATDLAVDDLTDVTNSDSGIALDAVFDEIVADISNNLGQSGNTAITPLLVANLPAGLKADVNKSSATDTKSAAPVIGAPVIGQPVIGQPEKAINADQEPAPQKTAQTQNEQATKNSFSASLEATTEEAHIEEALENILSKRSAPKATPDKHEDHHDFLQSKSSASETHPAASDRAISVAIKATDSPAPTLNGSAGGGSPIALKTTAATPTALTGLEGLSNLAAGQNDQVTFAGTLRATKEAQASLIAPGEQVAVNLHRMAKSGASQYDLHLHPAELGRVDIRLEISKDGVVQATVTADNQQTFDMLQRDARSLERALQQAGLQTDSGSLSFNLRGEGQSHAQQHAHHNNGNAWNKWMDKTLPEEVVQSKVLSFETSGNGRIDLRV